MLWAGVDRRLDAVADDLVASQAFSEAREVRYHGVVAYQQVAETEVVLNRPARTRVDGKQREVPGRALPLRLVVSRVVDAQGELLARWLLLTNAPATVGASTVALWYYWRWRIESYFKLLKSHGQQIEHWQQASAAAIGRRCLVAAMACAVVWELESRDSEEATQVKAWLIRLSGRQMKRGRPVTTPALLAGLFVLLPMLELLEEHGDDVAGIRKIVQSVMPHFSSG